MKKSLNPEVKYFECRKCMTKFISDDYGNVSDSEKEVGKTYIYTESECPNCGHYATTPRTTIIPTSVKWVGKAPNMPIGNIEVVEE